MPSHETKKCLRCGAGFECKAGNITQCQCFTVQLTKEEMEYVSEKYDECLCASCLKALQEEAQQKLKEANALK
ncbi:cysteine-rich CWC family protein [Sediminitomix flava]|uniref:Cysteine-rich CWC n=1 Tax=Sediminitomix flava TaxID=379075 RepID=A0A315Z7B9_SEDFL|nr:Cysteine-rich CWC [Sediminitomix flava]